MILLFSLLSLLLSQLSGTIDALSMSIGDASRRSVGKARRQQATAGIADNESNLRCIHKVIVERSNPTQLLEFLSTTLPGVKRTKAKVWLSHYAVIVNGEIQTKFDYEMYPGDVVIVRSGKASSAASTSRSSATLEKGVSVIYEDDDIIVVDKPYNMSTSKAMAPQVSGQEAALLPNINAYLSKKRQRAFLVHHMDKEASGIVLFAKTQEAKSYLQKYWSTFGRSFVCACRGYLSPLQGSLTTYHDESDEGKVKCFSSKTDIQRETMQPDGGDGVKLHTAINHYRTLETTSGDAVLSLLEVSLETNRKDQVRCQLAHHGHPLVGETVYFPGSNALLPNVFYSEGDIGTDNNDDKRNSNRVESGLRQRRQGVRRLALHASEIRITHPSSRETVSFTSRVPSSIFMLFGPANNLLDKVRETVKFDVGNSQPDGIHILSLDEYLRTGAPK